MSARGGIYSAGQPRGKLCSDPRISNADLYVAFHKIGGYTATQISRLFGKNYYTVRQAINREMEPEKYRY